MTLDQVDQVARRAAAELWTETERDVEWPVMLADLRHARRRRQRGWVAASAAAVTVVLTVVAVVSAWPGHRAVAPARSPLPANELLLVQTLTSNGVRLEGVGGRLPHLPRMSDDPDQPAQHRRFWNLAFSRDGARLAYSDSLSVGVIDLASGTARKLRDCRYCAVAWTPTGRVLSAAGDGDVLHLTDPATGVSSPVRLPSQWRVTSIDVSPSGRILLGGVADSSSAIMTIGLEGQAPDVIGTYPGALVYDPRWSPDGDSVAFLRKKGAWDQGVQAPLELRMVAADGGGERLIAAPSTCVCDRETPHLDWSDSGRLAVLAVQGSTYPVLHEVALDGTVGEPRDNVVGAIAWRPATTGSSRSATAQATSDAAQAWRDETLYTRPMVGPLTSSGSELVQSFAFSPDGGRVAYSSGTTIVLSVPGTNDRHELAACPADPCPVAWTPAGDRVVTASPGALHVIDVRTDAVRTVALPRDWRPYSLDVSLAGRVLIVTYGPLGEGRLATLPLAGGPPTVLHVLPRATFGYDARWSPDGRTIAWMSKAEANLPRVSTTDLVVNTVGADGTGARRLAVVGRCACLGHVPGLDWSPRGRLAVMSSDGQTQKAFEVDPTTGRLTTLAAYGPGPVAWRPAG